MEQVHVNVVGVEPPQAHLTGYFQVVGGVVLVLPVQHRLGAVNAGDVAGLGDIDHVVPVPLKGRSQQYLRAPVAVGVRAVVGRNPQVERLAQ